MALQGIRIEKKNRVASWGVLLVPGACACACLMSPLALTEKETKPQSTLLAHAHRHYTTHVTRLPHIGEPTRQSAYEVRP